MNAAAQQLLSQIEKSSGEGGKLTVSLSSETAKIVESWRPRGASCKETVEQLLRIANEELLRQRTPAAEVPA